MLRHTQITLDRIDRFTIRIKELIYSAHVPLTAEYAGPVGRISHAEAERLDYRTAPYGLELGPLWSTFWFRLRGQVPKEWQGRRVDLLWVSHSEATLWRDGQPVQGLNYEPAAPYNSSRRPDAKLFSRAAGGDEVYLEVEVACNQLFGWDFRLLNPYKTRLPFVFDQADLALFNQDAWDLYLDYVVLADILKHRKPGAPLTPWTGHVMAVLNDILNHLRPDDPTTWPAARARMQELYSHRNASWQHEISAIGHAHIDTAWLWPLAETRRKCIRTFASALAYMEDYPEYKFCCSQAQQYSWIKEDAPDLYERIKAAVKRGQWIPVGGSWIEPDCNIPSGESLARQFIHGKRFFRQEFGVDCNEFWNPDVFGYSGALPQILRESGFDYFLTQKLSLNEMNKPMHHSFLWEGIDGTRILTHFPPADTYNGMGIGFPLRDILFNVTNFKDHDRSNQSMFLFGYGDGGGGPTREMLEALRRIKDLQGVPRTEQRSPAEFFKRLDANLQDAPVTVGELYFELTRGCYTTQSRIKRANRLSEYALRDVEILSVIAASKDAAFSYPAQELDNLWKLLLLNQFHDIIPGSSIREVNEESEADYARILEGASQLAQRAIAATGEGPGLRVLNTCSWQRRGLVELPDALIKTPQTSFCGQPLQMVSVPSMGTAPASSEPPVPVTIKSGEAGFVLENQFLRAELSLAGKLTRLFDKSAQREALQPGAVGNQFVIFDDNPTILDAWDVDVFHLECRDKDLAAKNARLLESGPLRAMVEFQFAFGNSTLAERVSLAADSRYLEFDCDAEWRQLHQILKVEFPVAVAAQEASFEIQFGYLKRPTHYNTSYDIARFETNGQKWTDMSEPDYGVALFTDSKFGYDVHQSVMRISLLRAPTHPDIEADQGAHQFRFAIYPHTGTLIDAEVTRRAYEFNCPMVVAPGHTQLQSWLSTDSSHLIVDTMKKAEDSNAIILRLYETHGIRGSATLKTTLPFSKAWRANLLEEKQSRLPATQGKIQLDFKPFQILTILLES
jgi:alpha-mannosidase